MVSENIKILSHNELLERIIPFPFFYEIVVIGYSKEPGHYDRKWFFKFHNIKNEFEEKVIKNIIFGIN